MTSPQKYAQTFDHLFLVDNGSLRPEATLGLRRIAADLSMRMSREVEPVSMLHSSGIPETELNGQPAEIFEPAVKQRAEQGARTFLVLPLFFGPSRALTEYVPARVDALRQQWSDLEVTVAPCLADDPEVDDPVLIEILASAVRDLAHQGRASHAPVLLCDHGTPIPEVSAVRDRLAAKLVDTLPEHQPVVACSMERREGDAYAFNEPLLEKVLRDERLPAGPVLLAHLFLLPGRHAGSDGDVAEICREAERERPGLQVFRSRLVGEDPRLLEILARRYEAAVRNLSERKIPARTPSGA